MSWLIRPLKQVESHKWRMTAVNIGNGRREDWLEVTPVGGFTVNDSHDHATEEEAQRCDQCQEWSKQFRSQ